MDKEHNQGGEKQMHEHHGPESAPVVEGKKMCGCGSDKKCCCAMMKNPRVKWAVLTAIVLVLLSVAYYCRGAYIAAMVDGSPIWRSEVTKELEKQGGKTALDNLVLKKIIQNEIAKKKISVSKDVVDGEITKIEDQIKSSGSTLTEQLTAKGMTRQDLFDNIMLQKEVEQLLPAKTAVSDKEAASYLASQKVTVPAGKEAEYLAQAKTQIEQEQSSSAMTALLDSLKAKASINLWVNY